MLRWAPQLTKRVKLQRLYDQTLDSVTGNISKQTFWVEIVAEAAVKKHVKLYQKADKHKPFRLNAVIDLYLRLKSFSKIYLT